MPIPIIMRCLDEIEKVAWGLLSLVRVRLCTSRKIINTKNILLKWIITSKNLAIHIEHSTYKNEKSCNEREWIFSVRPFVRSFAHSFARPFARSLARQFPPSHFFFALHLLFGSNFFFFPSLLPFSFHFFHFMVCVCVCGVYFVHFIVFFSYSGIFGVFLCFSFWQFFIIISLLERTLCTAGQIHIWKFMRKRRKTTAMVIKK